MGRVKAFMPRKCPFMDATVARGFMPDGTMMVSPTAVPFT